MSSEKQKNSSELTEEEKKMYVQRLMKMRCTCGSLDNYVNIPKDHGVVAGSDQQPLLNANDHVAGENIIHFGKCHSSDNPKYRFAKKAGEIIGHWILLSPLLTADFLEKIGVVAVNCEPKTDEVWIETNEKNVLDGAPALLMGSCLTCRYGGTITFVKPDPEVQENTQTDDDNGTVDYVKEDTHAVIADAINRISAIGEKESSVKEAQMYLLKSTVLPAAEAESECAELMDSYFESYMEASFSKALICTEQQSKENYIHNMFVPFKGDFLDEDGMIIDQSSMAAFKINSFDVSQAGYGAVAAYNTLKLVTPDAAPSFANVIYGMEEYGLYCNTYGLMPAGITNYLMSKGLQVSYETTDLADKIGEADVGIVMYITDEGTHYVTCAQNDDGSFAFYNLPGGEGVESFEEFETLIGGHAVTMMALTVSKNSES